MGEAVVFGLVVAILLGIVARIVLDERRLKAERRGEPAPPKEHRV